MPVAGRSVVFVLEAESLEQADDLLCELPLWNHMDVEVCDIREVRRNPARMVVVRKA
jgi:hypothetical protein